MSSPNLFLTDLSCGIVLSLALCLTAPCQLSAQNKIESWYDYQWHPCESTHARFYSTLEHTDSGWRRMDYYTSDGSVQMVGLYEDSACKKRNGYFLFAYPKKQTEAIEHYVHGSRQGLRLSWHPNGMMADSANYQDGRRVGVCKRWYANGFTSDSCVYAADGRGVEVYWFDNGKPSAAGPVTFGGKKYGRWQFWHKNGNLSSIERWEVDKLVQLQHYDETGNAIADTVTQAQKASFPGGDKAWLKYMNDHCAWPAGYELVNGDLAVVVVTFTVNEEGGIQDAFVSVPFFPPFEKTALHVVVRSPKWKPAIEHNRRVSSVFRQAVIFRQPD